MLHLIKPIIERIIDQVPDLVKVGGPELLAGLPMDQIGTLLPCALVAPGPGTAVAQNTLSKSDIETQEWQVVLIVGYQYTDNIDGLTEVVASQYMTAIKNALHDWRYSTTGQRRQFRYIGRDAPEYGIGFAEFSLNFTVDANIV